MAKYNFNGATQPSGNRFDGTAVKPEVPFAATKTGIAVNTVLGLPKAALTVGKDLLQGVARGLASTGLGVLNATAGKVTGFQPEIPKPDPSDKVGTKLYNFLYGSGEVKDLSTRVAEGEQMIKNSPTAKSLGLDKFALPLAFGTVVGSATLDLVPGGIGEKNAIKALTKEVTEEGALKLLKKLGVGDEIAKSFAPKFAAVTDETAAKDLLDTMKSVHGSQVFAQHLAPEGNTVKLSEEPGFFRSKTTGNTQKFASVAEKDTLPAILKDGLDTFIVKDKDGYAVIEGRSGMQIGDTADNIPDALKSAKETLAKTPDIEDIIGKQALSPRYVRAEGQALNEINLTSKADRLAAEKGLAEQDILRVRESEKAIQKFGKNTDEVRKGIEDMGTRISVLTDQIDNSEAKSLWNRIKSIARVNYDSEGKIPYFSTSLRQIQERAIRNPAASDTAKKLDDIVKEYGFKDVADAQAKLETWLGARSTLKDLKETRAAMMGEFRQARTQSTDELSIDKFLSKAARKTEEQIAERDKDLKGIRRAKREATADAEAQAARLRGYNADITKENGGVIPPQGRGNLTPPELSFSKWKDKEALSLNRETMERNIEKVAGEDAPMVKKFLVDSTRKNETERIQFVNDLRRKIKKVIVKGLGIRSGSLEDQLVQKLGEKSLTIQEREAIRKSGKKVDWEKIYQSASFFREQYDTLLERVNKERSKFGYAPIPKRADYFRHFQEIGNAIQQFGLILREQDLPTEIAGITGIFNPGKPFSTAELRRKGLDTTFSAVKGFDNYLSSISKQIFHIDSVQRGRVLEKYIREAAKGVAESNTGLETIKLPHFVSNLHDFTNILAGKKSALDRSVEALVGRKIYGITNWLSRKTSANMLGANFGSAITNFAPFVQSLATTNKMQAVRGLGTGLLGPFLGEKNAIIDGVSSGFLTRRFPEEFIDMTKGQKAKEYANVLFRVIDNFVSRSVTAGKYYELVGKGATKESAMKAADEYAGRVIADRSIGNLPNLFNSQSLKPITQFQVEVNNLYSFLKHDIPQLSDHSARKITSAIAQFTLYSYLFNNGYQKLTGRRPILDPIYTGLTLLGLTEESEGTTVGNKVTKAAEDVAGNLPFVGGITGGRFPITAGLPNLAAIFNGESTWTKELGKTATYIAPPFGGGQVMKSYKGLKAYLNKKVTSASGKTTKFKVKQTPENLLKGLLFGTSGFNESQKYYTKQDQKAGSKKKAKYSF